MEPQRYGPFHYVPSNRRSKLTWPNDARVPPAPRECDVQRVRTHRWTIFSFLIVVPLGLYSKFYVGPAALWVNNALVGVWYEIFWCLLIFFCRKTPKPWVIAVWVFSLTCLLEVLQLWHPPALVYLRGFFLGRIVLGTTFAWSDFPHYMLGCALAWLWMRWLQG